MSTATITQQTTAAEGALASQRLFESMTSDSPTIDTRTPRQVRAQAEREGWK
jgi:hypothetical protein